METEARKFGYVVGGILLVYAVIKACVHLPNFPSVASWVTGGIGIFLIVGAFVWHRILIPLYLGWMKIGGVLGKINATVLLGIIFFLILTPLGLLRKLLKQSDPRFSNQKNAGSYWINRTPGEGASSLKRPF